MNLMVTRFCRRFPRAGGAIALAALITATPAPRAAALAQDAAEIAYEAYDVLDIHCAYCHMPGGAVSEAVDSMDFILDRNALVERGRVIPRRAAESPLYMKMLDREMPPDGEEPQPGRADVRAIERWIDAGAPDWDAEAPTGEGDEWPSFRGPRAAGVADGQDLPETWDAATGENIQWKTEIPGLAHGSPIVWGDRAFVTTAISSRGEASFRPGLYGDGDASDDRSAHQFRVYALDTATGKIVWDALAAEGVPRSKRHIKSTYASQTPATDGNTVVAFFGSEGLHAFDMEGEKLWSKDVGVLDVGAYNAPEVEWGPASSPIIHGGRVIVQCDTQAGSFILACDLATGETIWRTEREELPSWGTPTICELGNRIELVTNASNYIRSYDPGSGAELWRLGGSSMITAPTPIYFGEVIIVASGRAPERPIFAIRAGANGDLTLPGRETSSAAIAWSKRGRGSYMPTPLIYRDRLYVLGNAGIFDAYELGSGEDVYRKRIAHQGSGFSASPVAADGRIYLPSEDGDIFVVEAGDTFRVAAVNPMGETVMATPALADGRMLIRGRRHLFAVGK